MSIPLPSRRYRLPAAPPESSSLRGRLAQPWREGGIEPRLSDMLADPLVQLVMRSDDITPQALHRVIAAAQSRLRERILKAPRKTAFRRRRRIPEAG